MWCRTLRCSSSVTLLVTMSRPRYICIASALMISPPNFSASSSASCDLPAPVAPRITTIGVLATVAIFVKLAPATRSMDLQYLEMRYKTIIILKCLKYTQLYK